MNKFIFSEINQNNYGMNHIRSFVRRQRKLTNSQFKAIKEYWSIFGVNYHTKIIDINTLFGRNAPTVLEIGFGMGSSLLTTARDNPQQNFLGIEVYLPGLGSCLSSAQTLKLKNIRIIFHDAVQVIQNMIPDNSLDIVQLFFPDPWHKSRHNKRRIVQPFFADQVLRKLKIGGIFHIATDWQPYADHILCVMNGIKGYLNISTKSNYIVKSNIRPTTKFELRGQQLGHSIWDLIFEKTNNS